MAVVPEMVKERLQLNIQSSHSPGEREPAYVASNSICSFGVDCLVEEKGAFGGQKSQ